MLVGEHLRSAWQYAAVATVAGALALFLVVRWAGRSSPSR
jgi:uncharacterized membrane protein YdjX (TVP38/TMEM64 family)